MIHKNSTIGDCEGVTLVELGKGDVKISTGNNDPYKSTIFFHNADPKPIGTLEEDAPDQTAGELGVELAIMINKPESAQVLIDALHRVQLELGKEVVTLDFEKIIEKAKKWDDFNKQLSEKWYASSENEEDDDYEDLVSIGEWVGSYMGYYG